MVVLNIKQWILVSGCIYKYYANHKKNKNKFSMNKELKTLAEDTNNTKCFDCGTPSSDWANVSYSIFICIDCAGAHRSHGVKVSRVKSIFIDKWSEDNVYKMKIGGNLRLKKYMKENAKEFLDSKDFPEKEFYFSKRGENYKRILQEEVEEKFGKKDTKNLKPNKGHNMKMEGGGYSFPNSDSESSKTEYQKLLQSPIIQSIRNYDYKGKVKSISMKSLEYIKIGASHAKNKGEQLKKTISSKLSQVSASDSDSNSKNHEEYYSKNYNESKNKSYNETKNKKKDLDDGWD